MGGDRVRVGHEPGEDRLTGPRCAGLLLTGGASRRLGGVAKADLLVGGERLADRTARVLAAVADPVVELGPGRSSLDAVVEEPPGRGPLAALAAARPVLGARGAGDRPVLVVAVDLPFVDPPVLAMLAAAPPAEAVVPRVGGIPQPLCARYSPRALTRAARLVADGARAMRDLLAASEVRWLDEAHWSGVTSARGFTDVDTIDDVRRAGLGLPG